MNQQRATVLWNRQVGTAYKIGLACTGYDRSIPGQFVMVQVSDRHEPLLRRPFSIHGLTETSEGAGGIELLYKVVGVGTGILANLKPGQTVDILGPLGNGFSIPAGSRRIYLVGGGFFFFFTQDDLLCLEDFEKLGVTTIITTDDGSAGEKCSITQPLEQTVVKTPPEILCACGPLAMLRCLIDISRRYHIPSQISLETMMACGMGACLGCAVEKSDDSNQYWHACKDGPVFDANLIRI
ncbi:MAG: dihydroorotate dehydrogenase electron transfer subunit [Deltaproteobacteria bacterium]|nr:dihydroorotate dehydrogenase electron transfer subunit [Deltaproteobacteria bacterium]